MKINELKIKMLMAKNGYGVYEFCKKANITPRTYYAMTNNENVSLKTVYKIAKCLSCEISDLVGE